MTSQVLFTNARIFTAVDDDLDQTANCLLVREDKIEHIGSSHDETIQNAKQQGTREIDVGSRLLAPSFFDGHMHILMFAAALQAIQLDRCKSLEDIRRTIKQGAAAKPDAPRVFVQGWMHSMTDSKAFASDLDDLDPRPIYIYSKDLHFAWCNTAALEEMKVAEMPDPEGGKILRDENGKATGLMAEAACIQVVWPHLAKAVSREEKLAQIRYAVRAYNAAGYTGICEMATDEEIWSLLTELYSASEPPTMRTAAHWLIKPSRDKSDCIAQVDRAIELHKDFNLETSPNLRIAGIKVIGDGIVDACTASLREPYTSPSTNCEPIWSYEQLQPVVQHTDAAGLQCAVHAIGDKTVKVAVDALSTLASTEPSRCRDRRHRMEHIELTSPEDSKRLGTLGITASIQPVHADPAILDAWPKLIGHERCGRAFAYKEFADNGAPIAIGTDAPTAPHAPLKNLYTATTRKSAREPDRVEAFNEHFKLGFGQALRAATYGTAYSCFADRIVGTLEKGKMADFVILDVDWDAENLLKGQVDETWFAGKQVYSRK